MFASLRIHLFITAILLLSLSAAAQEVTEQVAGAGKQGASTELPRLIRFAGSAPEAAGQVAGVRFAVYAEAEGGAPLWQEVQNVRVDAEGRYAAYLGAESDGGVPAEMFVSNQARWLAIAVNGGAESRRVMLVSVPYAMKAKDAETLGGRPVTDFLLAPTKEDAAGTSGGEEPATSVKRLAGEGASATAEGETPMASSGTAGKIGKFINTTDLGDSIITENNGKIGINTANPLGFLDINMPADQTVRINNLPWALRIGSLSSGSQFFGMGVTKTAADNNYIATTNNNPVVAHSVIEMSYDGSIRFRQAPHANDGTTLTMTDTLTITPQGNVGIGTASPQAALEFGFNTDKTIKLGPAAWALRVGSLASGTQFISTGVTKTANDNNYIASSNNIASVKHSILEMNFDGTISFKQQDHQTDGTVLNPSTSFVISPVGTAGLFSAASGSASGPKLTVGGSVVASTGQSATEFSAAVPPPSGIRGDASATGQLVAAAGLLGTSTAGGGAGVFGQNNSASGFAVGTFGISTQSVDGTGLYGLAQSATGDAVGVYGVSKSSAGTGLFGLAEAATGDAVGVYGLSNASGGTGVWGEVAATSGANWGVLGRVKSADTNAAGGIFDYTGTGTGNILIGRNGTTKVFRVDNTGKGFFNGGTQLNGADFAESVAVEGVKEMYSPGDVLVIDSSGTRRVALAQEPYSRLVAGIYSTKPGILATPRHMDDARIAKFEVPLAIVGIVPTKVTTENGPIRPGDLLVSSSIPGHAMKGTDAAKMMGAVVGKALQSLDKGEGVIEVLVTLQ